MPQITSVYLTAAATLFGVLLTVAVQAITSATQRRHDRIARTFDIRLELYTKMRSTMSDWAIAYQAVRRLQGELSALIDKIRSLVSHKSDLVGVLSGQVAVIPREILDQYVKEIENKVSVLARYMCALRAAQCRLKEMSHTVALLASKPVDKALAHALDEITGDAGSNKLDFDRFDRAARKELGVKLL